MRSERTVQAAFALCLGILLISVHDIILRVLSDGYPVTMAITIRSLVALPLLAVVNRFRPQHNRSSKGKKLLLMRSAASFLAYLCYYLAIAAIPLSEAVTLTFVSPLVIAVLGAVLLGERLRVPSIAALSIGFMGVIVAIRPDSATFDWASVLPPLSALFYGLSQIITRKVSSDHDALTMAMYQNWVYLAGAPVLALAVSTSAIHPSHPSLVFLARPWITPGATDAGLLVVCGALAALGTVFIAQAYRISGVAKVAVFEYSAIVWVPLWAFIVFAEVPAISTAVGAAIIVVAGYAILQDERKKHGTIAAALDP